MAEQDFKVKKSVVLGGLAGTGVVKIASAGAALSVGTVSNAELTNSSITVNGTAISLGGSGTITAANPNALTIGTGLSGTSYNGSAAVTIAIDSTVVTLTGTQTLTNKTLTDPTLNAAGGTLVFPSSASPAQTANGSVVWNSTGFLLTVGTGSGRKTLVDTDTAQSLTNKKLGSLTTNGIVTTSGGDGTLSVTATTGSGSVVLATSPTLTTPTLGVATATSINKVTITAPATSATLTIADGKTLTASNTLTFTGTDSSSVAFGSGGTVAYTANKLSVFAATSSDELAGVINDEVGWVAGAKLVFNQSPTIVSPSVTTSITTGTTGTFSLVNTTATTVNFAGGASTISIGAGTGTTTINHNLTVAGNLTINGTTTQVNSTVTTLDDPIITLGGDTAPGSDDNKDRGVEFRWHNGTAAKVGFFGFNDDNSRFMFIADATNTSEVFSGTLGDIEATTFYGALSGNATTATTLATARTINGVSFNGSANITITASTTNSLTVGTGLQLNSGTTFDGSAARTISIDSTVATLTGTQTLTNKTLTDPTINAGGGTLVLPGAATPAQTANGSVVWDNDGFLLTVGTGSGRKTLLDTDSTQTLTNKTWNGAAIAILYGGTGATTAQDARNNLLPSQSTHTGKYLQTDGTNVSWQSVPSGAASSLTGDTLASNVLYSSLTTFGTVTALNLNGAITLKQSTTNVATVDGESFLLTAATATAVDTVALSAFKAIEYTLTLVQGTKTRVSKVLVATNGTVVEVTEYGIVEAGTALAGVDVTAVVASTNCELRVTVTDANTSNVTCRVVRTIMVA